MRRILRNWIARHLIMAAWFFVEKDNSAEIEKSFETLMVRLGEAWDRL
jgi:hypothetical protein